MESRRRLAQRHIFALECRRNLLTVAGVLPVVEELCNQRRLLHTNLQEVGDSLREKVRLDLPARYVFHFARSRYGTDVDMSKHGYQVAETQIDVRFHRWRETEPGFKIQQIQLAELRQHLLVSTVADFDLRVFLSDSG